jgi:hypothetical protein
MWPAMPLTYGLSLWVSGPHPMGGPVGLRVSIDPVWDVNHARL